MNICIIIAGILSVIIEIAVLVKYFILCSDVHIIKEALSNRDSRDETPRINDLNKKFEPTKADVLEFKRKYNNIKKQSDNDSSVKSLIEEYNKRFNADFTEYIDN